MTIAALDTHAGAIASDRPVQDATVERLIRWAEGARAAHSLAEALCRTPFCPRAFQSKPVEAAAAMLAGSELGLSPLASLRSFDVIEGAAAPRAMTLRAVVQSQGHEIVVVESTATRCRIKGRRRGESEWQESIWTIDRARQLKLNGKENWQKQPQGMLLARATSEIARMIASDAILGVPYTSEELADQGDDEPATTATATQRPATRTVRRQAPVAVVTHEPADLPPLPGEDEPAEPPRDGITRSQLTKLAIALKEAGMTDRDRALEFVANTVGRDLTSSKDLTKTEASTVIEALAQITANTAAPADAGPALPVEDPPGWAESPA